MLKRPQALFNGKNNPADVAGSCLGRAAYAQNGVILHQAPATGIDEGEVNAIVVTAQKRTQTLNDAPIAVVITTGEQLTNRKITDTAETLLYGKLGDISQRLRLQLQNVWVTGIIGATYQHSRLLDNQQSFTSDYTVRLIAERSRRKT